jgi:hypothetical protein
MTTKILEVSQEFLDMYGKFLIFQCEKYLDVIKDSAEFVQKSYTKYKTEHILGVQIYLDQFDDLGRNFFSLNMGIAKDKVCVWLEWNLDTIGKVAFDEFVCYDENDFMQDAILREKSRKNTNSNCMQTTSGGPTRISP